VEGSSLREGGGFCAGGGSFVFFGIHDRGLSAAAPLGGERGAEREIEGCTYLRRPRNWRRGRP
jgi:hypothetical protein